MSTVRIKTYVSDDRTIRLPDNVPVGPVEVTVTFAEGVTSNESRGNGRAILEFLESLPADRPGRSKDEIDRQFAEERASWDERDAELEACRSPATAGEANTARILRLLQEWEKDPLPARPDEEIEREIREERASWDRAS